MYDQAQTKNKFLFYMYHDFLIMKHHNFKIFGCSQKNYLLYFSNLIAYVGVSALLMLYDLNLK